MEIPPNTKKCLRDGCIKQPHALGYCNTHYKPAKASGLIGPRIPCVWEGCHRFQVSKAGRCHEHQRYLQPGFQARQKRHRERPGRKEARKKWDSKYNATEKRKNTLYKYNVRRAARLIVATPKWADTEKIRHIYDNCPAGFAVDHIVPIFGKIVSGLHVESNLQYLPTKENLLKGNKFDE